MRVIFRADSGISIGSGHVMRCLALACALREKGGQASFICAERAGFSPELITAAGFELHVIPVADEDEDARLCSGICLKSSPDWLVMDHYGLGCEWERELRLVVPRIMAIEDVANRTHEVDLLLDQNLREDAGLRYRQWLPESCSMLLGPRYALLRPQFAKMRSRCEVRSTIPPNILVFMGGGDERNVTLAVLKMLAGCQMKLSLEVVIGNAHPAKELIESFCAKQGWHFHCQVENMAGLMSRADLAIGAGGVTGWERCALGLPALLVILADNQDENVEMLERVGAAISLGWWDDLAQEKICEVLDGLDGNHLTAMSRAGFDITDGLGADRVAAAMLKA
jgi:UDP-2,4-diacetamido-2,4,6-trideoxy-beta-L-altropyranose hydrolase